MLATAAVEASMAVGRTATNPPVGCVIVRGEEIIAKGRTADGGVPHAEAVALSNIRGDKGANGATAYLTLEPCAHHAKTPPCAELLIKSGIKRVVVAAVDPDPRVNGRGIELLRRGGVATELLPLAAADAVNCGFFRRMTANRPWVSLKMALAKGGEIAIRGKRTKISGAAADNFIHDLRLRADAIAVGANTVAIDKPSLSCRLLGYEGFSPLAIVFSHGVRGGVSLENGLTISEDLPTALASLAKRGINRLLVEGGAALAASFLEGGLVDEVYLIRSKQTLVGDCLFAPERLTAMAGKLIHRLGEDMIEHCYVQRNHHSSREDKTA